MAPLDAEYERLSNMVTKLSEKFDAILLQFMRRDEYEKRHESLEKRCENLELRITTLDRAIQDGQRMEQKSREDLRDRTERAIETVQTNFEGKLNNINGKLDTLIRSADENRMTNIRLAVSLLGTFVLGGGLIEVIHILAGH